MSEAARGNGAAVLIAASSGRAIAAAAAAAGYRPLVADLFDDLDTRAISAGSRLAGNWREGFRGDRLTAALEELAQDARPVGLVYGAGFEDRPELLEALARRWPLLGNAPAALRRAKDPARLADLCRGARIAHPEIRLTAPDDPDGWLVKSVGGAGGAHVAPASSFRPGNEQVYFQRLAPGRAVSALCLGDGAAAATLGLSRQWAAPAPGAPFRYGGATRPAGLPAELEARLAAAAEAAIGALGLVGLNGVDFLVEADALQLVEINPRPGATLDIFDDDEGFLFRAHVEACLGRLPARRPRFAGASAAAIFYARADIAAMPALDWPEWTADRQKSDGELAENDPLCTIRARAADPDGARRLILERTGLLTAAIDEQLGRQAPWATLL